MDHTPRPGTGHPPHCPLDTAVPGRQFGQRALAGGRSGMLTTTTWHAELPFQQTLFDFGSLSVDHALAFQDLLDIGLHAVLCTKSKGAIWPGWPDKVPLFDDLVHHDGPIAHVPGKLGLVVYDADGGTPESIDKFCHLYPPFLRVPSVQPGRAHLYYTADVPVKGTEFSGHGVSGEIRSCNGYAVLWHDAVIRLRDVLYTNHGRAAAAPLHLIHEEAVKPLAKVARLGAAPVRRRSSTPSVASDETSPDPSIFDRVRRWAYETSEGADYRSWERRVLEEIRRCNAEMRNPLTARRMATMAASIADWVWQRRAAGYVLREGRRINPQARRDGIASGVARRLGTPLEHNRAPWVGICSRATWYRKCRYSEADQPSVPKPWVTMGIRPEAFRQRVRRARARTYKGAQQGILPWEYVGISEEEWVAYDAVPDPLAAAARGDASPDFRHAVETEQSIGSGRACRGPEFPAVGICDPVLSAEILADVVASCRDRIPSSEERVPANVQAADIHEAQKAVNGYISKQRSHLRRTLAQESAATAVAVYLECLDIPYRDELARRGLPQHSLSRPLWHMADYDPETLGGRKKFAMTLQQAYHHDLRTADHIYEHARRLGMVPPTPPWVIARETAKRHGGGGAWWMSREDRRLRRRSERTEWNNIIAGSHV